MRRRTLIGLTATGIALLAGPAALSPTPILIWNATASVPIGLYRIGPRAPLRVGDLVLALHPPQAAAVLRNSLPPGVPLLKRVAATAGSTVCRVGPDVILDGRMVARAMPADSLGRPLPAWSGCRRLPPGEVFLLNHTVPASLDGRYFGGTPVDAILGKAVPLWTP